MIGDLYIFKYGNRKLQITNETNNIVKIKLIIISNYDFYYIKMQ